MAMLMESPLGFMSFGVYPVLLFTIVGARSYQLLRQKQASTGAPVELTVRLILACNLAIASTLTLTFSTGGGSFGLLLSTYNWVKTFNVTALASSSAAVDVLMGHYLGNIIRRVPPNTPPSRTVLACCSVIACLDLAQSVSLIFVANPVTTLFIPGLLVVVEIASAVFLATRCSAMKWNLSVVFDCNNPSPLEGKLRAFHRRLAVTGYLSAFGALAASLSIVTYSTFPISSANHVLAIILLFTTARACTMLGQVTFADPRAFSGGTTLRSLSVRVFPNAVSDDGSASVIRTVTSLPKVQGILMGGSARTGQPSGPEKD